MTEKYIKDLQIIERTEIDKEMEIIRNILQTSRELKIANTNFDFAQDDLIDYYVYQIKANQSKLNHLIKMAKRKGISVDMISEIEYRFLNENNEAV